MDIRSLFGWFLGVSAFILSALGVIFMYFPKQFSQTLSYTLIGVGGGLFVIAAFVIRGFFGEIAQAVTPGARAAAASQFVNQGLSTGAQGIGTGVKAGIGALGTGLQFSITNPISILLTLLSITFTFGVILMTLGYTGVIDSNSDTYQIGSSVARVGGLILAVLLVLLGLFKRDQATGMWSYIGVAVIMGLIIGITYFFPQFSSLNMILYGVFGLIGIFLVVYTSLNFKSSPGTVKSGISPTTFFKLIYYFLPYGIMMFTSLSDLLNLKFKYTTASLTGLIAVILNAMITKFANTPLGDTVNPVTGKPSYIPVIDSNYCGIPGFGWLGSNIFPQAMLFNLTTLAHLGVQIGYETNFDPKYFGASGGLFAGVFLLSTFMNSYNDCFKDNKFIWQQIMKDNKEMGVFLTILSTVLISSGAGALGGWITSQTLQEGFAGHVGPDKPKTEEADICKGDKCSADESGQFVAEIYQNGKIIGTSAQ